MATAMAIETTSSSMDDKDPGIVCIQLQNLELLYKNTQKGAFAYSVRRFLQYAIEHGNPQIVLDDPLFQTIFMDARLATDCGWKPT
jgi:hypothetical protein